MHLVPVAGNRVETRCSGNYATRVRGRHNAGGGEEPLAHFGALEASARHRERSVRSARRTRGKARGRLTHTSRIIKTFVKLTRDEVKFCVNCL